MAFHPRNQTELMQHDVDANLALGKIKVPQNTKVAAIEAYKYFWNARRGKFSRANQNGPEEYGFEECQNFDLNKRFYQK